MVAFLSWLIKNPVETNTYPSLPLQLQSFTIHSLFIFDLYIDLCESNIDEPNSHRRIQNFDLKGKNLYK